MTCERYVDIAFKCSVAAFIWAMLSLPTVSYLYNWPSPSNQFSSNATGCTTYNKSTCLQALTQYTNCSSCNDSYITIAANVDQVANDKTVQLIVKYLQILPLVSQTCISHLLPFMCLYLFPLCGANATTVSREMCLKITTVACKTEWQLLQSTPTLKNQIPIPNCESLPSINGQGIIPSFNNTSITNKTSSLLVNCSDQFILANGTCFPLCDKWKFYTNDISDINYVIQLLASISGIVCGCLLIIFSYAWRKKKMFAFPAIIIPYMSITIIILATFVFISSVVDRKYLFCTSKYLNEALNQPTTFCSAIGTVFTYSIIQLGIFWLGHVSIIFVKTEFPFYSKAIENSKIVHLTVVLLAVLLPCTHVIATFMTGGYLTAIYPQPVCFAKNPEAAYYSFALILCFICAIGGPLLIITFWNAFKLCYKRYKNSNAASLPTTEIKLLFLLCYFIVLGSTITTATTIFAKNHDVLITDVVEYFECAATGARPECDAAKDAFQSLTASQLWTAIIVLLGLFPAVHLLYVVNFGVLQQKFLSLYHGHHKH